MAIEGQVFITSAGLEGTGTGEWPTSGDPTAHGTPVGSFTFFGEPSGGRHSFAFSLARIGQRDDALIDEILSGNGRVIVSLSTVQKGGPSDSAVFQARVMSAQVQQF